MKTTTLPSKSKPIFVIGRPSGAAHSAWLKQSPAGGKQSRANVAARIFLPPHGVRT